MGLYQKGIDIINKNQTEILGLKSTVTKMKILLKVLNSRFEVNRKLHTLHPTTEECVFLFTIEY